MGRSPAAVRGEVKSFILIVAVLATTQLAVLPIALAVHGEVSARVFLANDWAVSGMVGLPLAILTAWLFSDNLPLRLGWRLSLGAIALASITAMGARGHLVATFAAVCVGFAISPKRNIKSCAARIGLGVAVVALTIAVLPEMRKGYYGELWRFDVASETCRVVENSLTQRRIMASEALHQFLGAPIDGVGYGNFGLFSCFYSNAVLLASPHNNVLHVLAELGLAGFIPLLLIAAMVSVRLVRFLRANNDEGVGATSTRLLLIALTAVMVRDFLSGSYNSLPETYLLVGMLVSALQRQPAGSPAEAARWWRPVSAS